ncbi:hypothetical protein [Candidatus Magnetominusculus xianensis]|uniref:hypothetical protein n=1 Tax=Candidatus Magnetominusculus xianensis TaxID=1748249 RepID=UPI0012ECD4BC|nr:hypothetical protein [Candidatus Magnetominusculus xianensis]MBF0402982.1 hypothetical protein [Nitrospirota bacterium]
MSRSIVECTACRKYITCEETCIHVEKELVPTEYTVAVTDELAIHINRDYKEVLNEIRDGIEKRKKIDMDKITAIQDVTLRAIAAMIYAGIKIPEIAAIINKSQAQTYRIIEAGRPIPKKRPRGQRTVAKTGLIVKGVINSS